MIHKVYCVYDNKALFWLQPFYAMQHGQAMRAFSDEVNTRNSSMNRHPTDYALFHVGEFDDQTGQLQPVHPAVNLGLAAEFLKPDQTAPLFDAAATPVPLDPEIAATRRAQAEAYQRQARANGEAV